MKKQLDILILAKADYSNAGYLYAEALRSVGVKAEAWAVNPSPRQYGRHANIFHSLEDDIVPMLRSAKAIQLMHSRRFHLNVSNKFVVAFHGGSRYRHDPDAMNEVFNPIVNKTIIQTGDLLDKGAKNQVWILPCIETDMIKPDFEHHDSKLVVAHYPHKSYVKGTEMIFDTLAVLEDSKVFCHNTRGWKYYINDGLVSWEENLKRIAGCDIYIEAVKPELRGKPYGEWGITALEAAALGRIVVTHFRSYDRYVKEYGPCPLQVANNAEEFRAVMMKLLAMSWPEIDALKRETRMWVEKFHSLKAVGQRLKEKVYESLFT